MYDKKDELALIVMARDQSLFLADIEGLFIDRYWDDCPYKKYLVTQTRKPDFAWYDEVVYTDNEMIWGDRLEVGLKAVHAEYVLLLAEDFFLKERVETSRISEVLKCMSKYNLAALWLTDPPVFSKKPKSGKLRKAELRIVPPSSIYRVCLQPIIYRKDYLMRFAGLHYSPWQFERKASLISKYMNLGIFALEKTAFPAVHAWTHGMWDEQAVKLMQRDGLSDRLGGFDTYPKKLELRDRAAFALIRFFPHLITNIRIIQNDRNEKKLQY